ncbi:MAG: DUF4836 family protein [Bacteroidales bacterium]|nr:DUF4836 family protein [Bacteroidales bacterium]
MRFFKSLAGKITIGVVLAGGITALVIYYIYFKKTYEHLKVIPDTTYFVATMNPMDLHDKLNWDEFVKLEMMEAMRKGMPDEFRTVYDKFVDDPMSLGIALKNDIYFFAYKKGSKDLLGLSMSIHKRSSFEELLETFGFTSSIKEGDGYKYIYPDAQGFVGWDKSTLLLVMSPNGADDGEMEEEYKRLSSLDEKEQLKNSNANFSAWLEMEKDIKMWGNSTPWAEYLAYTLNLESKGMMSYSEEEMKDNYMYWSFNFEKGQIVMEMEMVPNKINAEKQQVDKVLRKVDGKIFELIPGKDLMAAGAMGLNINAMIEVITASLPPGFDQILAQAPKEIGMSHKDLMEVIKGDFILGFYGVSPVEKQRKVGGTEDFDDFFDEEEMEEFAKEMESLQEQIDSSETETYIDYNNPNLVIAFTVNQATMKKLIDIGIEKMPEDVKASGDVGIEFIDEKYYKIASLLNVYMGFKDDVGYITTNEEYIKEVVNGTFKQEKPIETEVKEILESGFAAGYLNLEMKEYPETFIQMLSDNIGEYEVVYIQEATDILKDAMIVANGYKATWTMRLTKNENYAIYEIVKKINDITFKK